MHLSTFRAWTADHAYLVLSGLFAASIFCSAVLAIIVYLILRRQKKLAERYRTDIDTLFKRLQGLEDRLSILALSLGTPPKQSGSESDATAGIESGEATDFPFRAIREEIERLTTQLGEPHHPRCMEAAARPTDANDFFAEPDASSS